MISRLLCRLGWHIWSHRSPETKTCTLCGKQEPF